MTIDGISSSSLVVVVIIILEYVLGRNQNGRSIEIGKDTRVGVALLQVFGKGLGISMFGKVGQMVGMDQDKFKLLFVGIACGASLGFKEKAIKWRLLLSMMQARMKIRHYMFLDEAAQNKKTVTVLTSTNTQTLPVI
jgi:hypothetical protein